MRMKSGDYTAACARMLTGLGYRDADVKTDEVLCAADAEGTRVCVRCVLTGWIRVGELEVEEMLPLMRYYGADAGLILTNGRFTRGAVRRAKEEGCITLKPRFRPLADREEDTAALL